MISPWTRIRNLYVGISRLYNIVITNIDDALSESVVTESGSSVTPPLISNEGGVDSARRELLTTRLNHLSNRKLDVTSEVPYRIQDSSNLKVKKYYYVN